MPLRGTDYTLTGVMSSEPCSTLASNDAAALTLADATNNAAPKGGVTGPLGRSAPKSTVDEVRLGILFSLASDEVSGVDLVLRYDVTELQVVAVVFGKKEGAGRLSAIAVGLSDYSAGAVSAVDFGLGDSGKKRGCGDLETGESDVLSFHGEARSQRVLAEKLQDLGKLS